MSGKKQDHDNQFYFSQFHNKYTESSVLDIVKTLNVMISHNDIFGFGIYFKSNNTEFTIVLKLKERTGTNWIQITYILETSGWLNIEKKGDLGPKKLYEGLLARGLYTFSTKSPIQYPVGSPILGINNYFSSKNDIEYNLSQFVKYGGSRSKRHSLKKSRKQLRGGRKTSRKAMLSSHMIQTGGETINLKNLLLTPHIIEAVQQYRPDFDAKAEGFKMLPKNMEQGFSLTRMASMMTADIKDLVQKDPIIIRAVLSHPQLGTLYDITNGRHRVARSIIDRLSTINATIQK